MVATVNPDKCMSCGGCVSVCPVLALELRETRLHVDEKKCISCGACTKVCPVGAITLKK